MANKKTYNPLQGKVRQNRSSGTVLSGTNLGACLGALLMVLIITGVGRALMPPLDLINIILLYLLPVLAGAVWWGLWPSFIAAFMGMLAFDFFFVPPVMSFNVASIRYLLDLVLFLVVALVTGSLAARLRARATAARERERKTAALYSFSQQIAGSGIQDVLNLVAETVTSNFGHDAAVMLPGPPYNTLTVAANSGKDDFHLDQKERSKAQFAFEHGRRTDQTRQPPEEGTLIFLPISDGVRSVGALALRQYRDQEISNEQQKDIEAFMTLTALAITRAHLSAEAEQAKWLAESEKLHRSLLNAVSHDLRTPLSSIMGAVTSLLAQGDLHDAEARTALLETIREGAHRMNRSISNLLDMARLESGILRLSREWSDLVDIVGASLDEVKDVLPESRVNVDFPETLPLIEADPGLIRQVVINLLENAAKYSPAESMIGISAGTCGNEISIAVDDNGPAIPEEERDRIFDKFYRIQSPKGQTGTGLGLSICKGIVESHGGRIWVEAGEAGGNRFVFALPLTTKAEGSARGNIEERHGE